METISPLVSLLGKPGSRIEGGPGESVLPVRSVLFVPKEPAVTELCPLRLLPWDIWEREQEGLLPGACPAQQGGMSELLEER